MNTYQILPSAAQVVEFPSHYLNQQGLNSDKKSIKVLASLGANVAINLSIALTPLTILADVIIGLGEGAFMAYKGFDKKEIHEVLFKKGIVSPIQQNRVFLGKIISFFREYSSEYLVSSLPDTLNHKRFNIFIEGGNTNSFIKNISSDEFNTPTPEILQKRFLEITKEYKIFCKKYPTDEQSTPTPSCLALPSSDNTLVPLNAKETEKNTQIEKKVIEFLKKNILDLEEKIKKTSYLLIELHKYYEIPLVSTKEEEAQDKAIFEKALKNLKSIHRDHWLPSFNPKFETREQRKNKERKELLPAQSLELRTIIRNYTNYLKGFKIGLKEAYPEESFEVKSSSFKLSDFPPTRVSALLIFEKMGFKMPLDLTESSFKSKISSLKALTIEAEKPHAFSKKQLFLAVLKAAFTTALLATTILSVLTASSPLTFAIALSVTLSSLDLSLCHLSNLEKVYTPSLLSKALLSLFSPLTPLIEALKNTPSNRLSIEKITLAKDLNTLFSFIQKNETSLAEKLDSHLKELEKKLGEASTDNSISDLIAEKNQMELAKEQLFVLTTSFSTLELPLTADNIS